MMKKLLLILLCLPLLFSTCKEDDNEPNTNENPIVSNIDDLHLRKKPDAKSKVLDRLGKNEGLGYAGEWHGPWIKAIKSMGYMEAGIVGWVHKDYISAPNFKSQFLGNVNDVLGDEYEGAGCFMSGVEGSIMAYNIINLQGRKTLLENQQTENFSIYYNSEISIKLFRLTYIDVGEGSYKCLAIINYKEEEEVIFVEFMCGC